MQTSIQQIKFEDGRTYKVWCANEAQYQRFLKTTFQIAIEPTTLEKGIHTIKQWEQIISSED